MIQKIEVFLLIYFAFLLIFIMPFAYAENICLNLPQEIKEKMNELKQRGIYVAVEEGNSLTKGDAFVLASNGKIHLLVIEKVVLDSIFDSNILFRDVMTDIKYEIVDDININEQKGTKTELIVDDETYIVESLGKYVIKIYSSSYPDKVKVSCPYSCENGNCITPCDSDEDCSVTRQYCVDDHTRCMSISSKTCINPGTKESRCGDPSGGFGSCGGCTVGCENGMCLKLCKVCDLNIAGDTNNDCVIDISDAIFILNRLFLGGETFCNSNDYYVRADVNGDLRIDISDAIHLIDYLFIAGESPIDLSACIDADQDGYNQQGEGCGIPDCNDFTALIKSC